MQRVLFNFLLAMEAVLANRMRALLTGLGILFGVAAVIAMLAIGSGAKQSILERMKLIGANSIVIKAVVLDPESEQEGNAQSGAGEVPAAGKKKEEKGPGLPVLRWQTWRRSKTPCLKWNG